MKITHPNTAYTGVDLHGGTVLEFVDGSAEVDFELPDGVLQHLKVAGYGLPKNLRLPPLPELPALPATD